MSIQQEIPVSTIVTAAEVAVANKNLANPNQREKYVIEMRGKLDAQPVRQTSVDLANPGNLLTEQKARQQSKDRFVPTGLDSKGKATVIESTQQAKIDSANNANTDIFLLNSTDIDQMNQPDRDRIIDAVASNLDSNPGWKLAFPTFNPADRAVKSQIEEWLKHPRMKAIILQNLQDVLAGASPDYTTLIPLLEKEAAINNEISKLNSEKGTAAAGTVSATGLHKEIEDVQAEVDKFKRGTVQIDSTTTPPTVKYTGGGDFDQAYGILAKDRREASAKSQEIQNFISALERKVATSRGFPVTFQDPLNPAPLTFDNSDDLVSFMTSNLSQYRKVQSEYDEQVAAKDQMKQILDEQKREAEQKLAAKKARMKEIDDQLDPAKDSSLAKKRDELSAQIAIKKQEVEQAEQQFTDSVKSVLGDSVVDLMIETSQGIQSIEAAEGTLDERAQKTAIDYVIQTVTENGKFNPAALKVYMDIIKKAPKGKKGEWAVILGKELSINVKAFAANDDLKKYFDEIKNNPDKSKVFGEDMFKEIAKYATLKNPKALEQMFDKDEKLLMAIRGDVLPDLIEQVKNNPDMAAKLQQLGLDPTQQNLREKLAGMSKGKLIGILIAVALGIYFLPGLGVGWGTIAAGVGPTLAGVGPAIGAAAKHLHR